MIVEPYYDREGVTIYHGDALAVLPQLAAGSVDCLLTDPPYSSGGAFRGDRVQDVHQKYVNTDSVSGQALAPFTGDNRDQRSFGYWVALWLGECRRILVPGGIGALFTDWRQLPTMSDALQAGGLVWRGVVPWHKPNGRRMAGRWANDCEYVVWGTNGPRTLGGSAPPGFYEVLTPRDREHITEKPIALLAQLLDLIKPPATILDPFCGSGTTLLAAKQAGQRAIGIELEEHFCQVAARRCDQAVLPLSLGLPLEVEPEQGALGLEVGLEVGDVRPAGIEARMAWERLTGVTS